MSGSHDKKEILSRSAYTNVLALLINNEATHNANRNYPPYIADDYNFDRGYITKQLNYLEGFLVQREETDKNYLFHPRWESLHEVFRNPNLIDYGAENLAESVRRLSVRQREEFEYFFDKFLRNWVQSQQLEKPEGEHLGLPPLSEIYQNFIAWFQFALQGYQNYRKKILAESQQTERSKGNLLDLRASKTELLNDGINLLKPGNVFIQSSAEPHVDDSFRETFEKHFDLYLPPKDEFFVVERSVFKRW